MSDVPDLPDSPETTAVTFCATLLDEWVRGGVTDAVLAPGSRSTPMVLALAAEPRLRVHVHHDERAAGFVALGLGLATGRPAVVLTTSGTAAVELHPAVVEAHEANVPMLVCTADRPPELHGVGAPQTIDQHGLFGQSVRWFAEPGVPEPATDLTWRPLAAEAYLRSVRGLGRAGGPVHLNLAFREPLVGEVGTVPPGRPAGRPWEQAVLVETPPTESLEALAAGLAGRRGVIVVGAGIDDPAAVMALGRATGWPVLADPRSGCRIPTESTISHADALLRVPGVASRLAPEVVLRLGSLPASKVVGQWLAGLDAWQVGIERNGTRFDPDRSLDALIATEPSAAAEWLADHLLGGAPPEPPEGAESWAGAWAHADALAGEAIASVLAEQADPCEPAVARDVVRALPDGSTLVVSSSMPVRDVEWFAVPRSGLRVLANRGANGIDGVLSTAVGVALAAAGDPVIGGDRAATAVLLGDVAFLYDSNGLLGAARRGIALTVVVVDNDGGGIFSFLPQASALPPELFERLYGTPHGVDLAGLAAAHGISSRIIDRQVDLAPAMEESAALGGVHVLIIHTDRAANVAIHDELNTAVARALAP